MSFEPHVELNEELPPTKKYESYSMSVNNSGDTLDEPVIDTVVLEFLLRNETSNRSTTR
jgi:hypothetical protein